MLAQHELSLQLLNTLFLWFITSFTVVIIESKLVP